MGIAWIVSRLLTIGLPNSLLNHTSNIKEVQGSNLRSTISSSWGLNIKTVSWKHLTILKQLRWLSRSQKWLRRLMITNINHMKQNRMKIFSSDNKQLGPCLEFSKSLILRFLDSPKWIKTVAHHRIMMFARLRTCLLVRVNADQIKQLQCKKK